MERYEMAMNYKNSGDNCAVAVLKAYSDVLNINQDNLIKLGSGFGVGMGCLESTCGSLIAANMVLGLLNNNPRKRTMTMSANLLKTFEGYTGASRCKDLKGLETGIVLCPCIDCVKYACISLEEILKKEGIEF